jgi:hypothetical protein
MRDGCLSGPVVLLVAPSLSPCGATSFMNAPSEATARITALRDASNPRSAGARGSTKASRLARLRSVCRTRSGRVCRVIIGSVTIIAGVLILIAACAAPVTNPPPPGLWDFAVESSRPGCGPTRGGPVHRRVSAVRAGERTNPRSAATPANLRMCPHCRIPFVVRVRAGIARPEPREYR